MRQDRWVGIGGLIVAGIFMLETLGFEHPGWGDSVGMAFWPRLVSGGIILVSIYLIVRGKIDEGADGQLHRKAFIGFLVGAVYVGLLPVLGFLIVTPVFLGGSALVIGGQFTRPRVIEAVVLGIAGTGSILLVFETGLDVQLPAGLLG